MVSVKGHDNAHFWTDPLQISHSQLGNAKCTLSVIYKVLTGFDHISVFTLINGPLFFSILRCQHFSL